MKRSHINKLIDDALDILHHNNIKLPPFAYWTPDQWKTKGPECDEIRDCMLGWDVTDFGSNDFDKVGLVVFTTRNGHQTNEKYSAKTYCEKILLVREEQVTPMHFHWYKQEDIINRCGGNLSMKLYNRTDDNTLADTDVQVSMDGVCKVFPAGSQVTLQPGESITLPTGLFHEFWAEPKKGTVISFEVSKVNDDVTDNYFISQPRFPKIDEDCPSTHCLCTDYAQTTS